MDQVQDMSSILRRFNVTEQSNWDTVFHDRLVPAAGKVNSQFSPSDRYVQSPYKDQRRQNGRFIISDIRKCKRL